MPALEMAQETGKLVAWRKQEGDNVRKGEPLLEVETDKAVMEIESPADGILAGIKAEIGAVVPVGETIAWIVRPGETPPAATILPAELPQAAQSQPPPPTEIRAPEEANKSERPRMSPKARSLARQLGVDTRSLRGSGPGQALLARDIQKARERSDAPWLVPAAAMSSVARLMAERTTQSWTQIPHFFLSRAVDAAPLVEAREKRAADYEHQHGIRPTITDLLIQLVARVLRRHPRLNASWTPEGVHLHPAVHMGVAVAVEGGVTSVVIRDAHAASLAEIASRRRELAQKARTHGLRPADIRDQTFTLSNLGMYQVDSFQAIISPPQAAILAVGRIADQVVALENRPVIRPMINLTLSCDHRMVDGAQGALFLKDLAEAMEKADQWLE